MFRNFFSYFITFFYYIFFFLLLIYFFFFSMFGNFFSYFFFFFFSFHFFFFLISSYIYLREEILFCRCLLFCLSVNNFTQKLMNRFCQRLDFGSYQGQNNSPNILITTDYIFMKILPEMHQGPRKSPLHF